jgi:hypothetical protein
MDCRARGKVSVELCFNIGEKLGLEQEVGLEVSRSVREVTICQIVVPMDPQNSLRRKSPGIVDVK